jgi:hypothetical protein
VRLTDIIGAGSWFDSFTVTNIVIVCEKIVTVISLKKAISSEQCNISSVSCDKNYFKLSSSGATVILKF